MLCDYMLFQGNIGFMKTLQQMEASSQIKLKNLLEMRQNKTCTIYFICITKSLLDTSDSLGSYLDKEYVNLMYKE